MSPDRILVRVDGRELELSNLDKVLYPAAGYTKGQGVDPGTRAELAECCEVGLLLRDRLARDGLDAHPKISGKKGMQLVCPIASEQSSDEVSGYAHRIAEELEHAHPRRIVSRMAKRL